MIDRNAKMIDISAKMIDISAKMIDISAKMIDTLILTNPLTKSRKKRKKSHLKKIF